MHRGRKCTAPIELPQAGPGDALKAASPGLGRGVNAFFCIASCWQSDMKCAVLQPPTARTHRWKHSHRRGSDPGGPNVYSKGMYYITNQEQY